MRSTRLVTPNELGEELRSLTRQLVAWRLDELEGDPEQGAQRVAQERVADLLSAAMNLFERVLGSMAGPGSGANPASTVAEDDEASSFLEQLDRSIEEHTSSAATDIAFIAKLEMQGLEREVSTVGPDLDGWKLLELCERVRRHIVKATTALRRTLGPDHGVVLGKDEIYVTELVRSIQVRRRYAMFRKQVMDAGEAHPHHPWACLRLVGTSIAVLIGRREYRDFRIGDRMLLRGIQRVIISYLADPEALPQAGQRIWQDVLGALEIMQHVNRRPELLEHDHIMLEALESRLGQVKPGEDLADLLERVQSLIGRDEELDRLFSEGCEVPECWRSAVKAARAALEHHRAPHSAHEEILEANAEAARSGVWSRRVSLH